jgi:hypothetical protein
MNTPIQREKRGKAVLPEGPAFTTSTTTTTRKREMFLL